MPSPTLCDPPQPICERRAMPPAEISSSYLCPLVLVCTGIDRTTVRTMSLQGRDPDEDTNSRLSRAEERELGQLSPFELKARLLEIAAQSAHRAGTTMLDAARGN